MWNKSLRQSFLCLIPINLRAQILEEKFPLHVCMHKKQLYMKICWWYLPAYKLDTRECLHEAFCWIYFLCVFQGNVPLLVTGARVFSQMLTLAITISFIKKVAPGYTWTLGLRVWGWVPQSLINGTQHNSIVWYYDVTMDSEIIKIPKITKFPR